MDLLGSIMSAMDKPPTLSEKERQIIKKRKEEIEKRQNEEREKMERFKSRVEIKLITYFSDPKNVMLKFEPMDHLYRSIVHELAETHGFLSYAFGTDGIDRYIRIYRKGNAPCEDELAARRRGDPWNEEIRRQLKEKRKLEEQEQKESEGTKRKKKFVPNSNYKDKYAHLIGQDAALEAARKTETNKTYGFGCSQSYG
ncbi:unnamed protein product [Acanthoscelides obtectus]|uniref:R3H domain-containing protein n=2 Tax=Acanthoscelides obtectus TaxID=200917 RepID=A0A9P0KE22_ACAOB|nr:unnamed protein product [Acanthoscelides obtectus]CAK1647150.1 Sperm-associated antigen 7 [Acanthoscelides obtectus]